MRNAVHLAGSRVGECRVGVQLRPGAGDQDPVAVGGRAGHLRHVHPLIGDALDVDPSFINIEVFGADLHLLGRNFQQLLADFPGRLEHCLACHESGPGSEGPGAHRRGVGVGVVEGDPVVGHSDGVGYDLGLDGLGAVADVGGAREHVDATVRLDLDPRLGGIAVLVHPGRVFDSGYAASSMNSH